MALEGDEEQADVLVLGAGISGLVCASILLDQGQRPVLVDSYPRVGGNHLDVHLSSGGDDLTFDVGSLVFQDDSPLLRHFPEILDGYLPVDPSWSRVTPAGRVSEYPFSVHDDVLGGGPLEVAALAASALRGRSSRRRPRSALEFAQLRLGRRFVARSGLERYMERLCGVPADQIDVEFARTRMMWLTDQSRTSALLERGLRHVSRRRREQAPAPTNRQLVRPREGFAQLYAPAVEELRARGATFRLGAPLQRLHVRGTGPGAGSEHRLVTGDAVLRAPRVVSTVPIDIALGLLGRESPAPLPTVTLLSLFYSFSGQRGFDTSILYNFSLEGDWKRLTVHSDFYGRTTSGREYFTLEVVGREAAAGAQAAADAFRRHTAARGLFDGDLQLEGSNVLPHAYPVYTRGSADRARERAAALREAGVESLGRQGGFSYQPTARQSTVEAEEALRAAPSAPAAR